MRHKVFQWFAIKLDMRQRCEMLSWLLNILMGSVLREARRIFGRRREQIVKNSVVWLLAMLLFADDFVLIANGWEFGWHKNNNRMVSTEFV